MNELVKILPNFKKFNSYIDDIKNGTNPIMLSGLTDTGKVHFAYSTHFYAERPVCIITYNEMQAKKLISDLKYFTKDVDYFPAREILVYDYLAESKELQYKRISALNNIYDKKAKIVVTTIEATMQRIISKESLYSNVIKLKTGDTVNIEEIKEKLIALGYERTELVEGQSEFSIRGGIVDIAIFSEKGVRIELWGDEIESIRYFDTSTQRSTDKTEKIKIYPATEFVLEEASIGRRSDQWTSLQSDIDKYFNDFYKETNTLIDYIKKDYIIFLDEAGKLKLRSENILKDNENVIKSLIEKKRAVPQALSNFDDFVKFSESIKPIQTIYLEKQDIGFVDKQSMHAKRNGYSFSYREVNFFRGAVDALLEEVERARKAKKTVIVLPEGALSSGFECYDFNLLVISAAKESAAVKRRKLFREEFKQAETIIFSDLKIGDYIVHSTNGIGQFIGVNTITADGITKDYIKIRYKDDDILYIPTNNLDSIRKYIGTGDKAPKISRLGSKEWEAAKQKVKSNLREIARDLIELYSIRDNQKGFSFSKDSPWQKEFEDKFEFEETTDQLRAAQELKQDMEAVKPMDRLLCGDVGYGKTEVAIRGAFKAVMDQKQVAYLVPTTILAQQQYEAFLGRMKDYPVKIELLNRFRTKKEQSEIIRKLKLGEIDIVIGTHRLLSDDVQFKDLGFLIIDEEHRFGVKDKEKIKKLKTNIDVLAMTATPIPRTLHMSIVGVRDMSCLYEPPQDRREVSTYVLEYDSEVVKEAITKEIEREGQVFYIYNNVETIEKKAHEISKLVPEARIAIAHGQMNGTELEDIMMDFINKK
ncbi:MAG: DEAD/DEAH box helicase, partial [Firmicutes bacterium]|nr:DEAD/DEAH box helicase [Bacillota bacterium]